MQDSSLLFAENNCYLLPDEDREMGKKGWSTQEAAIGLLFFSF